MLYLSFLGAYQVIVALETIVIEWTDMDESCHTKTTVSFSYLGCFGYSSCQLTLGAASNHSDHGDLAGLGEGLCFPHHLHDARLKSSECCISQRKTKSGRTGTMGTRCFESTAPDKSC